MPLTVVSTIGIPSTSRNPGIEDLDVTRRFAFVRIDDPAVSPDDCKVVAIQTGETIGIVGMNEDRQRCAFRINTEEVAVGFASWREAALWLARQITDSDA